MIIIALSDIHGKLDYLPFIADELASADLVVISGDITNFSSRSVAAQIIADIAKHNPNILAVTGNCDPAEVDKYLSKQKMNLNCNCIEFEGITFAGLSGGVTSGKKTKPQTIEEHFADCLRHLESKITSADPLVFVSHQPANATAVDSGGLGSRAIHDFLETNQPILALSGHVHESSGKDTIGRTILVNPGPFCDGSYAAIEISDQTVKNIQIKKVHYGIPGKVFRSSQDQ